MTYLDIKELSPGGARRFQQKVLDCVATVSSGQENPSSSSSEPRYPPKAHAKDNRRSARSRKDSWPLPMLPRRPQQSPSSGSAPRVQDPQPPQEPQYLLLCVNTRSSTTLLHVEVSDFTNDQYLFQEVQQAYHRARENHEWRASMVVPTWLRKSICWASQILSKIAPFPDSFKLFSVRSSWVFRSMSLHRIGSADFVRVCAGSSNPPKLSRDVTVCTVSDDTHSGRVLSQMVQKKRDSSGIRSRPKKISVRTCSYGRRSRRHSHGSPTEAWASSWHLLAQDVPEETF